MAKLSYTDRAEIYGFVLTDTNSDGIVDNLQVVTNGGNDSITSGTYAGFNDVIYATAGLFSLNASGHLITAVV